jgi:hypothetical protein
VLRLAAALLALLLPALLALLATALLALLAPRPLLAAALYLALLAFYSADSFFSSGAEIINALSAPENLTCGNMSPGRAHVGAVRYGQAVGRGTGTVRYGTRHTANGKRHAANGKRHAVHEALLVTGTLNNVPYITVRTFYRFHFNGYEVLYRTLPYTTVQYRTVPYSTFTASAAGRRTAPDKGASI